MEQFSDEELERHIGRIIALADDMINCLRGACLDHEELVHKCSSEIALKADELMRAEGGMNNGVYAMAVLEAAAKMCALSILNWYSMANSHNREMGPVEIAGAQAAMQQIFGQFLHQVVDMGINQAETAALIEEVEARLFGGGK